MQGNLVTLLPPILNSNVSASINMHDKCREREIDCGKKKLNALKYLSHICRLIRKVLHCEILSAVKFPMKPSKMAFEITMKPDQYHKFMTILQKISVQGK